MTITALPAIAQTDAIENELELLGMAWHSIDALTPDQLETVWNNFTQISSEERAAYAAFVSHTIGTDLTALTDQTISDFRASYVGTFTTSTDFVRTYARARWFTPMASIDTYAVAANDVESFLDWIDYDQLAEALFHNLRAPYHFIIGSGCDHIFSTSEPIPSQPRISL